MDSFTITTRHLVMKFKAIESNDALMIFNGNSAAVADLWAQVDTRRNLKTVFWWKTIVIFRVAAISRICEDCAQRVQSVFRIRTWWKQTRFICVITRSFQFSIQISCSTSADARTKRFQKAAEDHVSLKETVQNSALKRQKDDETYFKSNQNLASWNQRSLVQVNSLFYCARHDAFLANISLLCWRFVFLLQLWRKRSICLSRSTLLT